MPAVNNRLASPLIAAGTEEPEAQTKQPAGKYRQAVFYGTSNACHTPKRILNSDYLQGC